MFPLFGLPDRPRLIIARTASAASRLTLGDGNRQPHGRPAAWLAVDLDGTAVRRHRGVDDRQPEAGAAAVARSRRVGAEEPLGDPLGDLRGHALAAIDRPRASPSMRVVLDADRHRHVRRGVHEGVADDVGDHLPQPVLVAVDDDRRAVERRRRSAGSGDVAAGVGGGVARQRRQVDRTDVERALLVEPARAPACRRRAGRCAPPPARYDASRRRALPDRRGRRGGTARRSRGSSSPACAARARRRRRSGASVPRTRRARRASPRSVAEHRVERDGQLTRLGPRRRLRHAHREVAGGDARGGRSHLA